ncbi:MAG: S41 family peptidase [Flavobacteriaceae bacterium]
MPYQKKYLPLIIGMAVAAGIFIGERLQFNGSSDRLFSKNSKKEKLNRLIDYIEYDYVDAINTDSIVDVTVNGILKNLDPHSTYIPKENLERVAENMKGDFVGIGINFYTYKDSIAVIRALDGGPSDQAGIKGGDRILIANADTLYGNKPEGFDVVKTLKGAINTKVNLTVYRKGEPELLRFTVNRNVVPIKSVDAAYMLTPTLGYIKINRFAESTYNEFKTGLDSLKAKGATQIALDLRDNPGGFLSIAEKIADEFLEDEKLILFTKNKRGHIEKSFATEKGDFETGEVFVLINENSASASEIIAGALQDNDKGTIIGRRSYGKGLVQREMGLGDGSAVRLTVSRYYTPTGRSIQRPYNNGDNKNYYHEYVERMESGELVDAEKIKVADSLKFTTPKGKVVYGGGGIIPDIFVPLENGVQNEILTSLQNRGIINYFMFEVLDRNRAYYNTITKAEFISTYEIPDTIVSEFQEYLNVRMTDKISFSGFESIAKQHLKASLGEQLFGNGIFYEISNKHDNMVNKVIALSETEN